MTEGSRRKFKLVKASLVGLVMTVIHASANRNSPALVGAGSGTISLFVVSGVENTQADYPSLGKPVEFNLDRVSSTILVKLVSRDPNYIACKNTSGFPWYCLFPVAIPLASLEKLRLPALAAQRPDHLQGE